MSRLLSWSLGALGALTVGVAGLGAAAWGLTAHHAAARHDVPAERLVVPADPATVARGRHVALTRACVDCHAADFGGKTVIDEPAIGRVSGANLTTGRGGRGGALDDAQWSRAVRHGVRGDGTSLLFMPSQEYKGLSDADVAAVAAYVRSLPPVDRELPPNRIGPVGRVLYMAGQIELFPGEIIDHRAARPAAPAAGRTAAYGRYLATSCTGCHGAGLSGGRTPGTPSDWPAAANLTPDAGTGIGRWTEADFVRALRTGRRPDGTTIDREHMPWPTFGQMSDDELGAIYLYLRTIPARPAGQH